MKTFNFLPYETDKILSIACRLETAAKSKNLLQIREAIVNTQFDYLHEFACFIGEVKRFFDDMNTDGVFKIKNLPTEVNSDVLTILFGELIGSIAHYEEEGDILMKITRIPGADLERPAHSNSLEFPPHTDLSYVERPPEFMLVYGSMISSSVQCMSTFCSLDRLLEHLSVDDLKLLQQPVYHFKSPAHYRGAAIGNAPILSNLELTTRMLRFRGDTVSTDNKEASQALKRLKLIVIKTTYREEFNEGDMYLVANWRALHGRTSLNPSAKRVINRIYINRT